MSNKIERLGMGILVRWLDDHGRSHRPKPKGVEHKWYDLIVDGDQKAELKATKEAFFGLSESQQRGIQSGELAFVFVVNTLTDEVIEYRRDQLVVATPKPETKFYYYHKDFR